MHRTDVSTELKSAFRTLRLGKQLATLPDRLRLARERSLDPEDVLLSILTDEVQRRAQQRFQTRASEAGLQSSLVFEAWDRTAKVTFDVALLDELRSLRFLERHEHVLIIGQVGVGKTMLAHALGHLAIAAEQSVLCESAEKLFHRLRASRLDGTHDKELRRLLQVDLLIIDDLALRGLDARETGDLYEIVSGRHRQKSMIVTSNREPPEWLPLFADPLQGQALVDRFSNNAHDLIVEGESYRKRQKPTKR